MNSGLNPSNFSRRRFIRNASLTGAYLTLCGQLPPLAKAYAESTGAHPVEFTPNIYLTIRPDDTIIFLTKKAEMGQQVFTALAQIAMDELGASLEQVKVETTPTLTQYKNVFTGASWSIAGHWNPLRRIMATAREMLIDAAAQHMDWERSLCDTSDGFVHNRVTAERISFGKLTAIASKLAVPQDVKLRESHQHRFIGKNIARLDSPEIVTGKAVYGADLSLENMRYACAVYPTQLGCRVRRINYKAPEQINTSKQVINLGDFVAVVANNSWTAMKLAREIEVEWDYSGNAQIDDAILASRMQAALSSEGVDCRREGEPLDATQSDVMERVYSMPFAAHMPMEPPVAVAEHSEDRIRVWAPTQAASEAQRDIARFFKLDAGDVVVHTTLIGGGFGRKLKNDFVLDAVRISAQIGSPVKLQWTRENDVRNGFLRPYGADRIQVTTNAEGYPHSLRIRAASPSILAKADQQHFKNGLDWSAVMGLRGIPYAIPNLHLTHQLIDIPELKLVAWRGTFANHHCFAIECLMDELANKAGVDPLDYRLNLLNKDTVIEYFPNENIHINHNKLITVLNTVAQMANWQQRHTEKDSSGVVRGYGIACHCYDSLSYAAHVVEIEVREGSINVSRVWCAFDCGKIINPDGVKAQLEGSIAFGLTSALFNGLSFEQGQIVESNFHDQQALRMHQMPDVSIELLEGGDIPGGVGECGLPSVTPAFINALFDATGKRCYSLPLSS